MRGRKSLRILITAALYLILISPFSFSESVTLAIMDFWSINYPGENLDELRLRLRNQIIMKEQPDLRVKLLSLDDFDIGHIEYLPPRSVEAASEYLRQIACQSGADFFLTGDVFQAVDGLFVSFLLRDAETGSVVHHNGARYLDTLHLNSEMPEIASGILEDLANHIGYFSTVKTFMPQEEKDEDEPAYKAVGLTITRPFRINLRNGDTNNAVAVGIGAEWVDFQGLEWIFPSWISTQIGVSLGLGCSVESVPDFGKVSELRAHLQILLPLSFDFFALGPAYNAQWSGDGSVKHLCGGTFTPLYFSAADFDPVCIELLPVRVLYDFETDGWLMDFELLRITLSLVF